MDSKHSGGFCSVSMSFLERKFKNFFFDAFKKIVFRLVRAEAGKKQAASVQGRRTGAAAPKFLHSGRSDGG